jgi:hypothetical protein
MAKQVPQNTAKMIFLGDSQSIFSIEDTVSVKDSAVYQYQKWKYLVKKQIGNSGENVLPVWLDDLIGQGWELVSQSVIMGLYIFKKPVR